MYASHVDGRKLTFVVSGMLWQRSLVMMDVETNSLWSHLLGKCMRGRLVGKELKTIPSVITDWKSWREKHPHTTVMKISRTALNYRSDFYQNPSRFVVGATSGRSARAWPFDQLQKQPVVNDQLDDTAVVVFYDTQSSAAFIYNRTLENRELTFILQDGMVVDRQTRSQWDLALGTATQGPLRGKKLTPLAAIASYRQAWQKFHPQSQYWQAEPSK